LKPDGVQIVVGSSMNVTLKKPFSAPSWSMSDGRELGTKYQLPMRNEDRGRILRVEVNKMTLTRPESK
jgi:hypothetical protein